MYRNTHVPGPKFKENGDSLRNERWLNRNIDNFQFRYGGTYWESQHWKVETGGSGIQVHPWLHSEFEVSWSTRDSISKISRKEERKRRGGRKKKDVKGVWDDSFYVVHELLGIFLLSCDCLRDKHCSLRTGPPLGE